VPVRLAATRDLPFLADVELRAAASFAEIGLAEAARWPTVPADLLARQQWAGLLWVAGDPPVGFAVALSFRGALHLHEMDVVPEARGRSLGRALIDAVSVEAARRGLAEVTLVTFRDVPWNAPFYARLGFRESREAARLPEIAAVLEQERRSGLAALAPRVVMARPVGRC
jgi:GNAT superfamily N-acetyltransferase